MRPSFLFTVLAAISSVSTHRLRPRSYDTHDYYAVELDSSTTPSDLAAHLGLEYEGRLGNLPDHHVFRATKHGNDMVEDAVQDLKRRRRKREGVYEPSLLDGIRFSQKQRLKPPKWKRSLKVPPSARWRRQSQDINVINQKKIMNALDIHDPTFNEQWHLYNTREVGNDLNVTGVWLQGITGKNATVCIIDDGLDMDSEDLKPNYFAQGSYDFNDKVDEPKPRLADDHHGTRCAGEVAAAKNNVCGVGVAWDSRISGIRILSSPITDMDEAEAMNFEMQENDIYSCSWGPPDDGRSMEAPGILIEKAMVNAVQSGRGGKGSIYVFAAGNGASNDDNCNFDGYTNSIYSVTVGAIDRKNAHPYYSEKCSAQLIVTYSSNAGDAIHTTDVGTNKCTTSHGGTSAAGPLAAGVFALALQVRPDLSWRDIQWLCVMTAERFDTESDWVDTALGRSFSHQFGYGRLNAYAFIDAAKNWTLVKPQAWYYSPWIHVKHDIPQGARGLVSTIEVTAEALKEANFERVEHITVTMNVEHTRRGDLSVELRSPDGRVSHLSTARKYDDEMVGYVDWTFMSVVHWGESGIGKWTIIVKDTIENEHIGTFIDWRLRLWGESIDGQNQPLLPIPSEHDDDDHDVTTTASPHTTSITLPSSSDEPTGNPTDHPHRPVKPTKITPSIPATTTAPFEPPIAATGASSAATPASTSPATPSPTASPSTFLPSFLPTFGASKAAQAWIYGSLALILIFCSGLALYLYLARRRRLRNNPRDNYEFAVLEDEDADDARPDAGLMGRRKGRRAGELYDAFAGESDEELFSDEESEDEERGLVEAYRDREEKERQFMDASGSEDFNEKEGAGSGEGGSEPES